MHNWEATTNLQIHHVVFYFMSEVDLHKKPKKKYLKEGEKKKKENTSLSYTTPTLFIPNSSLPFFPPQSSPLHPPISPFLSVLIDKKNTPKHTRFFRLDCNLKQNQNVHDHGTFYSITGQY